jgi:hypothetical protein
VTGYGHRIQMPNPNTSYSRCGYPLIMQPVIARRRRRRRRLRRRLGREILLDERLAMADNEGV